MAEQKRPTPGQIGWIDLTVPDAQALCAFYQHVTGWAPWLWAATATIA
jgi:predicted enzyme related to lactoylglutathione lyase